MAKTITLTTPGAKAHYSKSNIDANFDNLNDNFANFLHLNGTGIADNTMLGDLDMGSKRIKNVASPGATFDVATKAYVDATLTLLSSTGTAGILIQDADADTYVKVEVTADEDLIHLGVLGSDLIVIGNERGTGNYTIECEGNITGGPGHILQIGHTTSPSAGGTWIKFDTVSGGDGLIFGAGASTEYLEINGTIQPRTRIILGADQAGSFGNVYLTDTDGDTRIMLEETSDSDTIKFVAGGVTQLTLTTTDITFGTNASLNTLLNVGVGTTSHASGTDNCITILEGTFPGSLTANTVVVGAVDVGGSDSSFKVKCFSGAIVVLGQLSTFDDVEIADDLSVTGDVTIGEDVTIGGDITLTGGATITGAIALTGNLTITGALSATGNITLGDATSDTIEANGTINLDKIGTMGAAGWPSAWAYLNNDLTAQNYTTETYIVLNAEVYDTNSNFDVSTGRFTPTQAGKYLVTAAARISLWTKAASTIGHIRIVKNETVAPASPTFVTGYFTTPSATTTDGIAHIVGIFDMNGSTDFLSLAIQIATDTSITLEGDVSETYMMVSRIA